jgi:hypothetical protein
MSGGPPLRSSKFGDGTTSATMKESGEKAGMGRIEPVGKGDVQGHHSLPREKSKACPHALTRPGVTAGAASCRVLALGLD